MNDQTLDPQIHIHELGSRAREAARQLLSAGTEAKNTALREAAKSLRDRMPALLEANAADVASLEGKKPDSFVDRLKLTEERIEGIATALEQIAELPDPVGRQLAQFDRPNGLKIERVAVPIGVSTFSVVVVFSVVVSGFVASTVTLVEDEGAGDGFTTVVEEVGTSRWTIVSFSLVGWTTVVEEVLAGRSQPASANRATAIAAGRAYFIDVSMP